MRERARHRAPRTAHVARKRFGQHFLEPAWVDKIIRAIDPKPDETFLEIGPGHGALTRPLAARAKAVVAYEIDRDLAAELRETMPPNVAIVEGDFLETVLPVTGTPAPSGPRPSHLAPVRVAGNLPYNVASPIVFKLVDMHRSGVPLTDATLMLQREVADRLTASPGTRDYGALTVLIGHRASATRVLALPPGAFRPPPKVHSAVVRLEFHEPDPPVRDEPFFARLVRGVFTRRRKTLANALKAVPGCRTGVRLDIDAQEGIDRVRHGSDTLTRRPEALTIAEFARLADRLAK